MPSSGSPVPVVLFTYARPVLLTRVLAALKQNQVPLIHAFSDGAKGAADAAAVAECRAQLAAVDWAQVEVTTRPRNVGLGANVLAGVSAVAEHFDAFIVWEDDLVCVPGTYQWLCAALSAYAADERVMSVTAWTHPRVTPDDVGDQPYFDGRAECWVWGSWSRAWNGMTAESALAKMDRAAERGVPPAAYGTDLPAMARTERARNIWAVRWLYHHLQHGGLCLRPPWSMVEHLGVDANATNAAGASEWANPGLRRAPPVPAQWPASVEHPQCRVRWCRSARARSWWQRLGTRLRARLG